MTINAIGRVAAAAAIAAIVTVGMPSAVFAAPAADPVSTPAKPQPPAKPTRYCVVEQVTGSNIERKTCKTREQWIKQDGYDPTRK